MSNPEKYPPQSKDIIDKQLEDIITSVPEKERPFVMAMYESIELSDDADELWDKIALSYKLARDSPDARDSPKPRFDLMHGFYLYVREIC